MTPGEPDPKSTLEVDDHTALLRMTYVCRSILSRGFTTVRDCGGAPMALRTATQEWLVPGPRLVLCGHALTMTGGHGDFRSMYDHAEPECPSCGRVKGMTRLCDGVDACLKNTRDELRRGADFIKVLGSGGMFRPGDSLARV
jgi:imidazolonepropionase-like amidohydrolase